MIDVELRGLTKRYGAVTALDAVDLEVVRGELVSLLGPSGCGKTTLLRLIAGLLEPTAGQVRIGGRILTDVPPHRRDVGFVFQNYALFPHMTVRQNVAFGLRMRGVARAAIVRAVGEALDLVQLGDMGDRYPAQLSGGQQQRVALARALVLKPTVLLLDEPFGALDKALREQMQLELKALQRRLGVTTVFVTHDQEEALTISDRIAVMRMGRIEQIDAPEGLYERPHTRFVLTFVGQSNLFPGLIARVEGEHVEVRMDAGRLRSTDRSQALAVGDPVVAAVRPGKMHLGPDPPAPGWNGIKGTVAATLYLGTTIHYYVDVEGGPRIVVHQQNTDLTSLAAMPRAGEGAWVQWLPKSTLLFRD